MVCPFRNSFGVPSQLPIFQMVVGCARAEARFERRIAAAGDRGAAGGHAEFALDTALRCNCRASYYCTCRNLR